MDELWRSNDPFTIPGTNYTVVGYSVAAEKTSFFIQELKLMLDCGLSHCLQPEHIFITHMHMDHSLCLPNCVVQLGNFKSQIEIKPTIFVPVKMLDKVKNFLHTTFEMSKNNPKHTVGNKYNVVGVGTNSIFSLQMKKKQFEVVVFHCDHSVPCVGYGFSEVRMKLKDEYKDVFGQEIGKLRKSGIDVTEEKTFPIFCYLGDTSIDVFKDTRIFEYPTIFVECTFIDNEHEQYAKEKKHICWNQLEPVVKSNPGNTFVLYHFSRRYNKEDLEQFFGKLEYTNIYPWIN